MKEPEIVRRDDQQEIKTRLSETEDHLGAFVMFCRRNGFSHLEKQAESLYCDVNNANFNLFPNPSK
jgi:hypothetical protein